MPDSAKWGYEVGFVRNQELQYYTEGRPENARVEDGCLVLTGRKERFPNPGHDPRSDDWRKSREAAEYTAASLVTQGKLAVRYGRVEVRAKLPHGKGVWPAIWMLGTNRSEVGWPRCGEIDIMEFVGKDPGRIYGTVHWPGAPGSSKHRSKGGRHETAEPWRDFHVYAIEWSPERIDFFFDDVRYFSFSVGEAGEGDDNPFRRPHYLLVNLALGGSWGGEMDDSVLPQAYRIDYVRVYEPAAERREQ